jgi:hypothetical protein
VVLIETDACRGGASDDGSEDEDGDEDEDEGVRFRFRRQLQ